jgi:ABC-2 type transport system permease protein
MPAIFFAQISIPYWLSGTTDTPKTALPSPTGMSVENIGLLFTFMIYLFIFMYGGMVMHSVREEKSSRIVEIIISSVKPFELMMGKIIAVGLAGMTQFAVWLILIAGIYSASAQQISEVFHAVNVGESLLYFPVFFIGGYMLYAAVFASIGALVDGREDTQQSVFPVMLLLLSVFFIALYALSDPHGTTAVWASIIPFSSPVVMMMRLPFEVPLWQKLLSVVLLYATFVLSVRLSAKIYRTGILMYGKKLTLGDVFKYFIRFIRSK